MNESKAIHIHETHHGLDWERSVIFHSIIYFIDGGGDYIEVAIILGMLIKFIKFQRPLGNFIVIDGK